MALLAKAGIDVEGEEHGATLIGCGVESSCMLTFVGRYETEEVAIHDDGFQTIVVLHRLLSVLDVLLAHVGEFDIEAELAHRSYIGAELDAGTAVPSRDVSADGL